MIFIFDYLFIGNFLVSPLSFYVWGLLRYKHFTIFSANVNSHVYTMGRYIFFFFILCFSLMSLCDVNEYSKQELGIHIFFWIYGNWSVSHLVSAGIVQVLCDCSV